MDSMVLLSEIDGRKADRCWRTVSAPDGTYLHDLATPRNETFGDGVGPRENRGLEGVTFAQSGELPSRRRGRVRRTQGEGVKPDDQIFQPAWTHGIAKGV
jgi:hypothetical protein